MVFGHVVELAVEILHVENLSVDVLYVVVGTREGVLGNDRFCRSVAVGRFAVDGDFRHRFCYAVNSALDCGADGESLFAVPVVCACAQQRCAVDVREARHFFAEDVRIVTQDYTRQAWIGKFDVKAFFMSIDPVLLWDLLRGLPNLKIPFPVLPKYSGFQ